LIDGFSRPDLCRHRATAAIFGSFRAPPTIEKRRIVDNVKDQEDFISRLGGIVKETKTKRRGGERQLSDERILGVGEFGQNKLEKVEVEIITLPMRGRQK
jgi:hypothetical protein